MKFSLPRIQSPLHLSKFLELSPEELFWLSHPGNRRTDPESWSKHYRCHWIAKRSGGWRLIESPRSKLRHVQSILLHQIFNLVPPHPLAFGFCKNRSVIDFAKPHVGKYVCWRFDLEDFFTSVSTGRVTGSLRKFGYPRDVARSPCHDGAWC